MKQSIRGLCYGVLMVAVSTATVSAAPLYQVALPRILAGSDADGGTHASDQFEIYSLCVGEAALLDHLSANDRFEIGLTTRRELHLAETNYPTLEFKAGVTTVDRFRMFSRARALDCLSRDGRLKSFNMPVSELARGPATVDAASLNFGRLDRDATDEQSTLLYDPETITDMGISDLGHSLAFEMPGTSGVESVPLEASGTFVVLPASVSFLAAESLENAAPRARQRALSRTNR